MTFLILGIIIFIGVHLVPTSPPARAALVGRLGENGYKAAFGVASLIGFVLLVWGMGQARGSAADIQFWRPPTWTRHLSYALMWPAFVLLVAAYVPSRIHDMAKHPMLAAIKVWALAHLIANGNLSGLLLFGSFLAYGVYDRISVKKRGALGPLGARHASGPMADVIVVVVGTLAYLAMFKFGHAWLMNIPLAG